MAKKILIGLAPLLLAADLLATLDLPNQQPRLPAVKYATRDSEVGVRALPVDRPHGSFNIQVTHRKVFLPALGEGPREPERRPEG